MELSGLGGGVMLAIAAALWLAYLVPNWLKRREYLATELNAVRLQQTIRVLAETSELPAIVRMDAAARRAARTPVAVGRPVTLPSRPDPQVRALRRLRRTRALASTLLLAAIVVAAVQVVGVTTSAGGSWAVAAAAGIAAVGSLALLGRIAEVSRARRAPVSRNQRRTTSFADHAPVADTAAAWTPVALPKPLYLSRAEAPATAAIDPAFELHLAAASAERALRSIEQPPSIEAAAEAPRASPDAAPIAPNAARSASNPEPSFAQRAAPNKFARMGIVDDAGSTPDIDAALARRRIAG